jgi:hypothetical protein
MVRENERSIKRKLFHRRFAAVFVHSAMGERARPRLSLTPP